MSAKVDLYALPLSPPSRAVHLAVKLFKIPYNYIEVDVLGGGTRTPEYLKMNPQHTVPVIKHNNFVLSESRAILEYLYAEFKGNAVIGAQENNQVQALIHHRMYFDIAVLYRRLGDAIYPVCFGQTHEIPEKLRASLYEAMDWLEEYLTGSKYIVGDKLSIADLSLVATVSTYQACEFALKSLDNYPKTKAWLDKLKTELPDYETACGNGAKQFGEWFNASYKPQEVGSEMTLG